MYFQITECKRLNNYKIFNIKIINDCLSISRKEESHKYRVHGLARRMSQWVKSITIMPKDESSNPGSQGGKRPDSCKFSSARHTYVVSCVSPQNK